MVFAKSYNLKELIDSASQYNLQIKAKEIAKSATAKELDAKKSAYYPSLDIGASYTNTTPNSFISPTGVSVGYASISMDIYDGGRKSALVRASEFAYEASVFEKRAFEKSVILNITNHYYTIKKLQSMLHASKEQSKELIAQIKRVKKFTQAGLSTQEDVDKLQAVYDNNQYNIENIKFSLVMNREKLQLLTTLPIGHLKNSRFKEPYQIHFEPYESSQILEANANILKENANAIGAGYRPQIKANYTYNKMDYRDSVAGSELFLIDHQSKVTLSVNMRVFDNGKMKKEEEAIRYKQMALNAQRDYAISIQKMEFRVAKRRLKTIKSKLRSAKSALKSSKSTYVTIVQKYEAGLVDNIAYLDALNSQTLAKARYKETLYDYEIAKSIYYYYAGKNIEEFIR